MSDECSVGTNNRQVLEIRADCIHKGCMMKMPNIDWLYKSATPRLLMGVMQLVTPKIHSRKQGNFIWLYTLIFATLKN